MSLMFLHTVLMKRNITRQLVAFSKSTDNLQLMTNFKGRNSSAMRVFSAACCDLDLNLLFQQTANNKFM